MSYFSDRERGERPRDRDEIDETVWAGIQALIGASALATCSVAYWNDRRRKTRITQRA
jgi:hypothetical protein